MSAAKMSESVASATHQGLHPLVGMAGRRGLQAVLVALLVGTLSFFMMRMLPGDLAYRIAAGRYGYDLVSTLAADAVRAELGLDLPWYRALLTWLGDLLRLDLGVSLVTGQRVAHEIAHQLGHTLVLAFTAMGFALVLGPTLGVLAGLRPGGVLDRVTLVAAVIFKTLPPFLLGLLLIVGLSVHLGYLPAAGHGHATNLVLPALTLGLGLAATSCRVARDAMRGAAESAWFAFGRTKGLNDRQVVLRHGLRNAAVPVVAYLGVQLVFVIEGVVILETLFAWPGIGHALVHAIFWRDIPMIQGTVITLALLFVLLNALVDLACFALDPRRRTSA
ncbi:MAG: ABC transporter permease [Rhodocyclaceae bacterium]